MMHKFWQHCLNKNSLLISRPIVPCYSDVVVAILILILMIIPMFNVLKLNSGNRYTFLQMDRWNKDFIIKLT